ncbi:MAG: hypothetical protein IBX69_19575 [Anaerolineales bacterium]|nr:hypothetical protein [Anaerolineales bacterium]
MRAFKVFLPVTIGVGLLFLAACNFPVPDPTDHSGQGLELTRAAQTVSAQLTQQAANAGTTLTPPPPDDNGEPDEENTIPPGTTPEEPTPTPVGCDQAGFVTDVTIPDNTRIDPGEEFEKTWELRNTGTCTWTPGYAIVFDRGDSLGAPASSPLTEVDIPPDGTVEVTVVLTAPQDSGTYQGHWKLRNAAGQVFGLGTQGDRTFWVKVRVAPPSGIGYDFISQSPFAQWISRGGGTQAVIPFNGPEDSPDGVAKQKENFRFEDGRLSGVALLTRPKHTDDGMISGIFDNYTVEHGDYFRASLGFMENCGEGRVVYQFQYREGTTVHTLAEWRKSCDGTSITVERNLVSLQGKTVQFILTVLADGSPDDDLAVWGSARIER